MCFKLILSFLLLTIVLLAQPTPTSAYVTEFTRKADFLSAVYTDPNVWLVLFYNEDANEHTLRREFGALATEYANDFRFATVDASLQGGLALSDMYGATGEGLPVIKVVMFEGKDAVLKNWSLNGGPQPLSDLRIAVGKVKKMLKGRNKVSGYFAKQYYQDSDL
eukprot:PhM_4_TR16918/c0_g2_i1/m.72985